MRIGFMTVGEIEAHAGEAITTRFFYIGPLFFPVSGHFMVGGGKAIEI